MPTVTLQSIFIGQCGVKEAQFMLYTVASENEQMLTIEKEDGAKVIIYKDSMFSLLDKVSKKEARYVLNAFDRIGARELSISRFVMGDATDANSKESFFTGINHVMNHYYDEELIDGRYLNEKGQLCKKDAAGRELWIDYERVSGTRTHNSGYIQKYPQRNNNYPIPEASQVSIVKEVIRTAPKMKVSEWLNTPMEDLLSKEDKALADQRKLKREARSKKKGLLFREALNQKNMDKKRLTQWLEQKSKKAIDDAIYGIQLDLI